VRLSVFILPPASGLPLLRDLRNGRASPLLVAQLPTPQLFTVAPTDHDDMKALCDAVVLAESDDIVMVDGNPYFPRESMRTEYFRDSQLTTVCGWKGTARYWDVVVEGRELSNVVWSYETPKPAAENIRERFAFYRGKGVELVD
jgi:uncharacterized protein (DUF427 family)